MDLATFDQFALSGLVTGCVYALVAMGFVLCANVSGVVNFAQGEYVMIGGLVTASLVGLGVPLAAAALAAVVLGAALGFVQERLTVTPIRRAPMFVQITVTLAAAVLVRSVALVVAGKDPYGLPGFVSDDVFEIGGAILPYQVLLVWGATAAMVGGTGWLLGRTALGRAIRCVSINPLAADLMGIDSARISTLVFTASGAMGALAGLVMVPVTSVSWDSGIEYGLKGFTGALLGGFRSPLRATLGGLAIGLAESLSAGYISSQSKDIITYGALLLYLMVQGGAFAVGRRRGDHAEAH
ncbi:MAG TPA: branched-chain amino acid ABC transporter permease [Hyphomicrobiales bacterium]|nr:branched-chain amino acid ABC transporter permease [Hyphomicrobiales bacterium]